MDVTPAIPSDRQVVEGYGPGWFRVSGQRHEGSLIVFPGLTAPWTATAIGRLSDADLAPILEASGWLELLLLGTGDRLVPPPPGVRAALRGAGIGVEIMATGAACRTYNVLLAEGRRVGAALIPVTGV